MRSARILFVAAFCALSTLSFAGTKTNTAVVINDSIRMASGSLSSARTSADTLQFISCEMYGASGGIACKARNSAGDLRSCSSSDPNLARMLSMINYSSYVSFWWDTAGVCTQVFVRNGSNYLP